MPGPGRHRPSQAIVAPGVVVEQLPPLVLRKKAAVMASKLLQMPSYPPIGLSTGKLLANIARSTPMAPSTKVRMLSVVQ